MNDIIKAIKERRSIRKFKTDMPKKGDLEQIIEAGLYAANTMGKQETIIVAVTNDKIKERLSASNSKIGGWQEGYDPFYGAPAILAVLANKNSKNRIYDGSLVIGNMMLAAHSLGLGSIWIHRAKEEFEMDEWKEFLSNLGADGEWEGIGYCAVGYISGEIPQAAKRKDERVFWAE
ncbi:MAG: nitroreductase [Johnsonella sp.]|nr:nitroreductase [Johnsonella sp.]